METSVNRTGFTSKKVYYRTQEDCTSVKREFLTCETISYGVPSSRTVTAASVTYVTSSVSVKQSTSGGAAGTGKVANFQNGVTGCHRSMEESQSEKPPLRLKKTKVTNKAEDLVFKNGILASGTLENIINYLVPTAESYPEKKCLFAFLLNFRIFMKPSDFLQRFHHSWILQQCLPQEDRIRNSCANLIIVLRDWTETFPNDFLDDQMIRHLKKITHRCLQIDHRLKKMIKRMMQNLFEKFDKRVMYEESLNSINIFADSFKCDILDICPSPEVCAQQLTRIELEKLRQIGPEEFVEALKKDNNRLDGLKTKNLNSYVQFFNRIGYLVATEICKHLKKRNRVRVIEYFIEVACECLNRGNFNTTMAIISGMTFSSISRLKKTWAKVDTSKWDVLQHQMSPSSNFSNYRSTLTAAVWRSQRVIDAKEKIVIPFFSLLIKDLYFINEGFPNTLPNGHINFEKFWQLSRQITNIVNWQKVLCFVENDVKVSQYLLGSKVYSEIELALSSFECEPPENSFEKETLKKLK